MYHSARSRFARLMAVGFIGALAFFVFPHRTGDAWMALAENKAVSLKAPVDTPVVAPISDSNSLTLAPHEQGAISYVLTKSADPAHDPIGILIDSIGPPIPADVYIAYTPQPYRDINFYPYSLSGEPITYTYHITNTGSAPFTPTLAVDDHFGRLPELMVELAPGEGAIATRTQVVTDTDLPGPLVSTVTVTHTDDLDNGHLDNNVVQSATTTVTIDAAFNALSFTVIPGSTQVQVGDRLTFYYAVQNTGTLPLYNVTIIDDVLGPGIGFGGSFDSGIGGVVPLNGGTLIPFSARPGPVSTSAHAIAIDSDGITLTVTDTASVPIVPNTLSIPYLVQP